MTSLDDVYERMQFFRTALLEFDASLSDSVAEMDDHHDRLGGLWQDQSGQRYHQLYEPLAETMKTYLQGDAPRFEAFIEGKLLLLDRYLSG